MNNRRIGILGIGLALLLVVSGAGAAENSKHNPSLPWVSWEGAYFGAYFGAGSSNNVTQSFTDRDTSRDSSVTPTSSVTTTNAQSGSGNLSGNASGSIADLFVGYNYQPICNFVLGAQLEGTFFSDIVLKEIGQRQSSFTSTTFVLPANATTTFSSRATSTTESVDDLRSMFSFVARAGYLVHPAWLIYFLTGGTEGHFVVPDGDIFGGRRSKWNLGYTVGAGLEHRFNNNWSVRAEYRYLHFNIDRGQSSTSSSTSTQGLVTSNSQSSFSRSSSTKFNYNLGLIGIVYRFC